MAEHESEVRLSGSLICGCEQEADIVRRHLAEHIRLTRAEPGCMSFDVLPTDDPMIWSVEECFVDQASFEAHQHRTRGSVWWSATASIARTYMVTGLT